MTPFRKAVVGLLIPVLLSGCLPQDEPYFSAFQPASEENYHPAYRDYCAMPVDQFIIGPGKALILPSGHFALRVIDCLGTLRGVGELHVPEPHQQ